MIKPKTGKCLDCPDNSPDKPLIAGRCASKHYWAYRAKVVAGRNSKNEEDANNILASMNEEERELLKSEDKPKPSSLKNASGKAIVPKKVFKANYKPRSPIQDKDSDMLREFNFQERLRARQIINPEPRTVRRLEDNTYVEVDALQERFDAFKEAYNEKHKNANVSKPRKPIKRSPITKNTGTKLWMEYHIAEAEVHGWQCENCGSHIDGYNEEAVYGAQAHILPKNHFGSVKNVIENHMLLNRFSCQCHGQYDSNWLNASKMPIFRKAWHVVNDKLRHLLNPEELRRLPEVFSKPLKND